MGAKQITPVSHNEVYILLVEDTPAARKMMMEMLQEIYTVSTVPDGKSALTFLARHRVNLLLLDLSLPDMDGIEVLKIVRQDAVIHDLPIIITSARSDPEDVAEGLLSGANDYITKPIQAMTLRVRIEMQLRLKALMDERQQTIQQLERNQQLHQQLSHIASHDLKNPLNNLRLAEELLREENADNPRAMQLLRTIDASLDMMQHVVATFLDMVAIQTGAIELNITTVLLSEIINHVVTQYELSARDKQIELVIDSKDGAIYADKGRMIQVVGNLISNAIKYSPKQSTINISTAVLEDDNVRLAVRDQGPGIPEDERERLFQEFSKLSTRPTAGEGRTGLGLWIVKHLIDLQGGEVGAGFPAEGGSVFWVDMPCVL